MLEETGIVVSVSPGRAKVALVRSEACGNCAAKSMCHSTSEHLREIEVANPIEAKRGEKVVITLSPEALLKATLLAYLFPSTLMVAGAAVGWFLKGTDLWSLFGALAGLTVSSTYIYMRGRRKKTTQGPAISKILHRGVITQDQYGQGTLGI